MTNQKITVVRKEFMRAREIAENYPFGLSTIWDWAKKGKLSPIKVGTGMTVFRLNDVEKLFNPKSKKVKRRKKIVNSTQGRKNV